MWPFQITISTAKKCIPEGTDKSHALQMKCRSDLS